MPERSLLKEINEKTIQARLNTRNVKPMVFPYFFGTKGVSSLTWETLIGDKGAPVMADIISWDASTPEKKREVVRKATGDIPKSSIKRSMNETDFIEYQRLSQLASTSSQRSILDLVFKDLDYCYNGVRAKMEFCCMQILSTGTVHLTSSNNVGLITKTAVDYGVPAANKTAVATTWSTSASATPLADLKAMWRRGRDAGVYGKYFVMDNPTLTYLMNASDSVDRLKNFINQTGKFVLTIDAVNAYLKANQLPQIVEVETAIKFEDAGHSQTLIQPFETGRVSMITDRMVGDIQHGPIAAESSSALKKSAVLVKQDFVLTSKWAELEPFKEWTKAEANAFPVLNDPEEIFFLRTDNTDYDA